MCSIKRMSSLFFILCVLNSGVWSLQNLSISVPRAVLSSYGEATLHCSYDLEGAPLYSIRWYRGETEFYRYVPRELPPAMVFPLHGASVDLAHSNDKQVRVVNLSRLLSGDYQCEVSADAPLFHTAIRRAPLTVVDPPFKAPELSVSQNSYSRGDIIRANCTVDSAYPQPNITWNIDGYKVAEWLPMQFLEPDFRERSSHSQLEITIKMGDYDPIRNAYPESGYIQSQEKNILSHKDETLRYRLNLPSRGKFSLVCAADILDIYTRNSLVKTFHEDAPHPASRTRDINSGWFTVPTTGLFVASFFINHLL